MDATLFALITALLALVVLDLAALRWGHDSRPGRGQRHDWW